MIKLTIEYVISPCQICFIEPSIHTTLLLCINLTKARDDCKEKGLEANKKNEGTRPPILMLLQTFHQALKN